MQALAAYTQEGMVFAVDARLRPRGAEGDLVVTPAQLKSYFASEAQPWEALTYTKLRLIVGSAELGKHAAQMSETLFQRFAADNGFPHAVREMRTKLQNATAPAKSIRTFAGGLYDIDFLSSFLLVKNEIRPKTGTLRDRLWRCSSKSVLEKRDAALLDHAAELCRTVEHVLRLVTGRNGRWLPSAEHARGAVEKLASQILRREFSEGLEQELLRKSLDVDAQRIVFRQLLNPVILSEVDGFASSESIHAVEGPRACLTWHRPEREFSAKLKCSFGHAISSHHL